jgi:hypothetical protein
MKHKITFFTFSVLLAFMAVQSQCAYAQVFDKTYGKSLILGGGPSGVDLTHTVTISSSALTASEPLTLPATNAVGVLTNNGSGVLSWDTLSLSSFNKPPLTKNTFLITNGSTVDNWLPLNVDGTTLRGDAVTTDLGIFLGNANTWTAAQTMQRNSIGSTSTDALTLMNPTAAANNTQEFSPRLHLEGMGWASTSSTSKEVDWIAQVVPVQGSSNPTSYLDFEDGIANAGYASDLDIFSSGGATIGSSSPVDPGLGVLNFGTGVQIAGKALSGTILEGNGTVFTASSALFPSAGSSQHILRSNGTSFVSSAVNTGQFTPANPHNTSSTSAVMMGLGTTATITPNGSGRLLIIVSGNILNTSTGTGPFSSNLQIRYGTGTAPTNTNGTTAATGTTLGNQMTQQSFNNVNQVAFSLTGITPALTVGTAYWIDLSLQNVVGSGPITISNVSISVVEL